MLSEMVPGAGLEPTSLSARASKTLVSANSTTRALGLRMADFGYRTAQGKAETLSGLRPARESPEPVERGDGGGSCYPISDLSAIGLATADIRPPKSAAARSRLSHTLHTLFMRVRM